MGAGNQIYLFSRFLDRNTPTPSPTASGRSISLNEGEPEDLFQMIAWQNGPLLDYHPTVLSQCLIWGKLPCIKVGDYPADEVVDKMELVKRILVDLHKSLKEAEEDEKRHLVFKRLDPFDFVTTKSNPTASPKAVRQNTAFQYREQRLISSSRRKSTIACLMLVLRYPSKYIPAQISRSTLMFSDDDDEFNERLVRDLVKRLDGPVQIPLSTSDKALLATIIEGTFEVCHTHYRDLPDITDTLRPNNSDAHSIFAVSAT